MTIRTAIRSVITPVYIRARLAQEKIQSGVTWYPLDPNFIANPYPTYKELRERDPYHPSPLTKALVISRYEDVDSVLRNYKSFSNQRGPVGTRNRRGIGGQIENELQPSMLSLDPPDHTRLRGLVSRAFTPRQVAKMEDHIRKTAHALLDDGLHIQLVFFLFMFIVDIGIADDAEREGLFEVHAREKVGQIVGNDVF